jgi:hypothetical protein
MSEIKRLHDEIDQVLEEIKIACWPKLTDEMARAFYSAYNIAHEHRGAFESVLAGYNAMVKVSEDAPTQGADARIAELEAENEVLRHDIERHIANHAADLNATQGADARPVATYEVLDDESRVWFPVDADYYAMAMHDKRRIVYASHAASGIGPLSWPEMTHEEAFEAAYGKSALCPIRDRLKEIAYRDTAVSVTVRADDLRALLAASMGGEK